MTAASCSPAAGTLILDACTIINLHSARHLAAIVRATGRPIAITDLVFRECRLDPFWPDDEAIERTDLADLVDDGTIAIATIAPPAELATLAALAVPLEDGEAATLAIAIHRGWTVVTDDKAAIRELAGRASLLSTLDLVKGWVDADRIEESVVRAALHDLRVRGRYVPARAHPLKGWWDRLALP